ncbi:MAG: NAD(P)/FAD-dependent oxidoreductase [Fimbriiglobus sp.]|nr:NAD(P)/FAD-dependent oxidoreductase [Fimbriiglobus sp.]
MSTSPARHRVVIIGGGFGGLLCAKHLKKVPCDVTLLDRRNFHLFQPLLYQVATGSLSPANIAAPLRSILKKERNVRTLLADVGGFDLAAKEVLTIDGLRVSFDTLVVAAGSTHHYFGKDAEWEPIAPGLKTIEDATEIRRKVLGAFERAEREAEPAVRKRLLTFVVVGGGPTGVEMAGSVAELARQTLRRDFRSINPADAHVILVENSERVLQTFHEKLSANAEKSLREIGVDPWLKCRVTEVKPDRVVIDRGGVIETVPTETVIWAAGVKASPLAAKLKEAFGGTLQTDRAGRVVIAADCTAGGRADVFVIGDMAHQLGADGKPLPGVAPVAIQQGEYVARVIDARLRGSTLPTAFKYHDKGSMATIGRSHAVAQTGWMRLTGWLAWLAWLFIHVITLARFENRVLVVFQWFWNYVTRNRTARLITNDPAADAAHGLPASSAK